MRERRGRTLGANLQRLAAAAAFLVLTASCTGATERDLPDVDVGSVSGSPARTPGATGAAGVPTDVGRLAVLDGAGNLVTVGPDGSDAVVLAEAAVGQSAVAQPTWSPDGTRLAWVRLEAGGGGSSVALVTTRADGTRPTEAPTRVTPFYLSWDPTSSRIAYLGSPEPSQIELGIVDVGRGGTEATPLDSGQPFYLSWAPSGEQLLVHVGEDRLERLGLDGSLDTVDERPGAFRAPVWTSDGRRFVYASGTGIRQRLLVYDVDRERGHELLRFEGAISFVVSPDGTRLAFQVVAGRDDVGPLSVADLRTGETERVAQGFLPAFYWSPAGDRLLYLVPEIEQDRVWFRWGVWDGASSFTTSRFYPSLVLRRDYLPFFEQYAQSMSLWAPDGSAFAYAGSDESGTEGIWVQPARDGAEPVLVADGVFVAWSPA